MKHPLTHKGFTLIEVLVSVALFSVVMVVALGALLSMSVAVRTAEATNSAVNNLSSAIDSMSRSVRTGTNYHCESTVPLDAPTDCTSAASFFSHTAFDGARVTYCLSNPSAVSALTCNSSTSCLAGDSCTILRSIDAGAFVTLTSPEVKITYLGFYVTGAPLNDGLQPKVTMVVVGTVPVKDKQSSIFNLQTSVTQRIHDQ